MDYTVEIIDPHKHFIKITGHVSYVHQDVVLLQLPAWRPGRYQLANYAKNIRCFKAFTDNGKLLPVKKTTKDCWQIITTGLKYFYISYEYYANQYDAGASYANSNMLYINPVNCFMYIADKQDETFTVTLNVPDNYQIACQLTVINKTITANGFNQLADSPFIASAALQKHSFSFGSNNIYFWFMGNNPFNSRLIQHLKKDTLAYAALQSAIFGEFPCKNYHFLYHFLPYPFRHGVEHEDSTVISMGFTKDNLLEEFYDDLLAISSHELFHLWNVKRLRPADMLPYDFTKENYSCLGYVYEGVTTYYGDLTLLRSKIWDFNKYATALEADLDRHYNNEARNNYSVANSSFDTWLDGYDPGIEGIKVSINIEGCTAAMWADIAILKHTGGKKRLDNVMHNLYHTCFKNGKGYTQDDYKNALESTGGFSFEPYFNQLINGFGHWDTYITEMFNAIGCKLILQENKGIIKTKIVKNKDANIEQNKLFDAWIN